MTDKTSIFLAVGLTAVVLIWGLFYCFRPGRPEPSKSPHAPTDSVLEAAPQPAGQATQTAVVPPTPPSKAELAPTKPAETAAKRAVVVEENVQEKSWDFTPEDLRAAEGRSVLVDLGEYTVQAGEEFDVSVFMDAPALQCALLAMKYDRELLEAVPDSGKAVGRVFRRGVEFFGDPATGRMALLCATLPGRKNILAAQDEKVAVFRMRAKKAGTATIEIDTKGVSFEAGNGKKLTLDCPPGKVLIEQ